MEQDGGVSLSWLRPRILALTEKFSFERLGTGMRWGRLADLRHGSSDRLCGLGSLVIGRLSLSLAAKMWPTMSVAVGLCPEGKP